MREHNNQRLEAFKANPRRALWTLALPVLYGMLVQTAYSIADMIFVGRISADAIAAISFNFPIIFFAVGITFGLGSGLTAVIARSIGAGNIGDAENAAEHGLLLGIVLGGIFTVGGLIWAVPLLTLIGVTPELLDQASQYFSIIAAGFIFASTAVMFRSIYNGEGDTRLPVIIQSGGTILNVILDPILIFSCGWGVRGAAWATFISQLLVSLVFVYMVFVRRRIQLRLRPAVFRFNSTILRSILRIGLPASMSMVIMSFGGGIFNFILIHFSPAAVAGYQVAIRLDQIYFLPVISIAMALVTLVGMFYGARRLDLIRVIVRYGMGTAVIIGVSCGVIFWLIAPYVFFIFTPDLEIQRVATSYIRTIVFVFPLISVGMTSGRILQGLGRGAPMLVITSIRVALVSAPLAWIFTQVLGKPLEWVWYGMIISICISASIAFTWLNHRFRQVKIELGE
ncbi:MATE family efflux transporter [bacterium]|nr:MATE family efflux transporter [bacterium]